MFNGLVSQWRSKKETDRKWPTVFLTTWESSYTKRERKREGKFFLTAIKSG